MTKLYYKLTKVVFKQTKFTGMMSIPCISFFQTWFWPHFPRKPDGFICLTIATVLLFSILTPLPPGVNYFPTWKVSPAAVSSLYRGFYAENGTCVHCSSSCRTCEGNATNCHSCEGGLVLDHGVCQETCPERHVAMEGVCKHCPEMCEECIHEKTCKGTWEHPRGKCGSAELPWLGANYLVGEGCSSRTRGTSLPTFTEIHIPLCTTLRKVKVR